jgi:GAF domain-containing protein
VYATRREPDSFDARHLDFLTITASQVAWAVQRTRLLDRARRRAEELETLLSIAMVIASALDVDGILHSIYEQAGRAMDTSAFFIALFDPGEDELSFRLMYDQGERLEPLVVRMSESPGLTGYVIRKGQPLLIRNWEVERANLPIEPVLVGEAPMSWLCVPITVRGEVMGAIGAQSYEAYAFTARDERLLTGIASQAGISLQNARLMSELRLVNSDLEEMVRTQAYLLYHIGEMTDEGGEGVPAAGHVAQRERGCDG